MSYGVMEDRSAVNAWDAAKADSTGRLAARYSYLEREGLLPLPVQGGITLVVELRHAPWSAECLRLLLQYSGPSVRVVAVAMTADFPLTPLSEQFSGEAGMRFLPFTDGEYRVNEALAYAETSFVMLLEDCVMVAPGWIGNLLWPPIDDPTALVVAPCSSTEWGDGQRQLHFAGYAELAAYTAQTLEKQQREWSYAEVLTGSCLLIATELLLRVGGFDASLGERRLIIADWCLRARMLGAELARSDSGYVHVLHRLGAGNVKAGGSEVRGKGEQAYLQKWNLHSPPSPAGTLQIPRDLTVCPPQPVIPLSRGTVAAALVTTVVYFEENWTAADSRERQQMLQESQSYGNIRWVWVRDSWSQSVPEFPVHERDAVITVHGEKAWLHALENISALYGSEIIVYLSASASYDNRYVERLVRVFQHSRADLMVSSDDSAAESGLSRTGEGTPQVLPLERIAHRSGRAPGKIVKREGHLRSLELVPDPGLSVDYAGETAVTGAGPGSLDEAVPGERRL